MKTKIGKRFGKLIVIQRGSRVDNKGHKVYWLVRCDCGKELEVIGSSLMSGNTRSCGCLKVPKLIDKRFGRWTVIKEVGRDKRDQSLYLCKCDCGEEKIVRGSHLLEGKTKSCGCYRNECSSNRKKLEYGLSAKRRVYYHYKSHAKIRKILFQLTFEQFLELTQQSCHYCNSDPSNIFKDRCPNGYFTYNGIDRVDNTKGYIIENCVSCCKQCNRAKGITSYGEFINWVNRIYNNLYKRGKNEIRETKR